MAYRHSDRRPAGSVALLQSSSWLTNPASKEVHYAERQRDTNSRRGWRTALANRAKVNYGDGGVMKRSQVSQLAQLRLEGTKQRVFGHTLWRDLVRAGATIGFRVDHNSPASLAVSWQRIRFSSCLGERDSPRTFHIRTVPS